MLEVWAVCGEYRGTRVAVLEQQSLHLERLRASSLAMVVVEALAEMGNDRGDPVRRDAGGEHRSHQPELVL
jgi:hypothetical protein